jgi:predicted RNA-binding protein with EMAP domain
MIHSLSKKIQKIKFAYLSPDEIRKMSAIKIITADTYNDDGFPIDMGLMVSRDCAAKHVEEKLTNVWAILDTLTWRCQ